jgi:hypothetical protein
MEGRKKILDFQALLSDNLDCPILSDADVSLIENISYW